MTVTSGFYDSLNGDRKYNAAQFGALFEGIITDGIFMGVGSAFNVTAGSGLDILVGSGRAWFNGTWTDNDAALPIFLDSAEPLLKRIDSVVLQVDLANRENTIFVKKGTPSSTPSAPTMTINSDIKQYRLADIFIDAGATTLSASKITTKIGSIETPLATGIMQTMSIQAITAAMEDEFYEWFATLQTQLEGEVAVNLAAQIASLEDEVDDLAEDILAFPKITAGTAAPSDGNNGDIYLRYV